MKVTWYGSLTNYEDLCELYSGCDKLLAKHDPAQLVLTLYLQVCSDCPSSSELGSCLASLCLYIREAFLYLDGGPPPNLPRLQGYKDMYDDNSSQPQTWLAAAEVDF